MKSKKYLSLLFVLLIVLCSVQLVIGAPRSVEMNIATVWGTDDCAPNVALNHFKTRVEELSDGSIKVKLHKGTLGGERDLYEGLQLTQVEGAALSTGPLGGFIPITEIFMVPFLFKNWDHLYAAVDGEFGDHINDLAVKRGLRIIGWWGIGGRHLFGIGDPVTKPSDLKGKKIRVMETSFLVRLYNHYQALPTPMAYNEIYTGLQQGVIDGTQEGLAGYTVAHHEVCDWGALVNENFTPVPFVVSERWWSRLSDAQQDAIIKAEQETRAIARKLDLEFEEKLVVKWSKAGVEFPEVQREEFAKMAKELYPEYEKMLKDDKWLNWLVELGEKY